MTISICVAWFKLSLKIQFLIKLDSFNIVT